MRKFLIYPLITLGMTLMTNKLSANSELPLQYPLTAITISILHQTGHGIPGGYQITISGDGSSFYSRNGETQQPLSVDKKTLLELVNGFYQIHFFELADTYAVKKQVVLKDGTTVATIATKMVDVSSKQLCIQLADFKKCVTIIDEQPAVAAQLVKKIEALFVKS
jgi:hypothetical protein